MIEHSATVDFRDQVDLGIRAIREKSADHSIPRTFQFSCRNNSKSAVLLQAFVPTESRSSFVCLDSFFYDALVISPGSLKFNTGARLELPGDCLLVTVFIVMTSVSFLKGLSFPFLSSPS